MPAEMAKVDLTSIDPLALCNDGSPAVYYWKQSKSPTNNKWLVYLQSGAQCYDHKSCEERMRELPHLTSSKTYPEKKTFTGVLDENPELTPLADANKAYVMYCSSDGHMGDVGPTKEINY